VGGDTERAGFWLDMFDEEHRGLFSALDRSGLGREEQELALYLASERLPENELLKEYRANSRYNSVDCDEDPGSALLRKDYSAYFSPQEYPAMLGELKERVYQIYREKLGMV